MGSCFGRKIYWNKKIHRKKDEINGIGKHDLLSLCLSKPLLLPHIHRYMFCIYSLIVPKTNGFKYILLVHYYISFCDEGFFSIQTYARLLLYYVNSAHFH